MCLVLIGIAINYFWNMHEEWAIKKQLLEQQIIQTQMIVSAAAKRFDEDEEFFKKEDVIYKDAWQRTIEISVSGKAIKCCVVRSSGVDGLFDSPDDIISINRNITAQSLGESAGRLGTNFGIGMTKGVIEAVKEKFSK